jgi:prepilin-type N-terminal cleavage/methylation domain-containing protein
MITLSSTKFKKRSLDLKGFTLVELLVVIAIIGILAGIVVPNVAGFLNKGQMTKAVAEIRSVDTALVGMLNDVSRSNFRDILNQGTKDNLDLLIADVATQNPDTLTAVGAVQSFYQDMFYNLLREGKNSQWAKDNLQPEMRQKLGNSYMDLGQDAWGQNYQFWMGPLRRGTMPLRSFRVREDAGVPDLDDVAFDQTHVYEYDEAAYQAENSKTPGAPRSDGNYGYPAPKDLPVYVYSLGNNQVVDALLMVQTIYNQDDFAFWGGGDDINNWDNQRGWENAPR